jgi:hypothetical protein
MSSHLDEQHRPMRGEFRKGIAKQKEKQWKDPCVLGNGLQNEIVIAVYLYFGLLSFAICKQLH